MEKTYMFQNGVIQVITLNSRSRDNIIKETEIFLEKVFREECKNGNKHKTRNIREKRVLHR